MTKLITTITHDAQKFIDEPVYVSPKQKSEIEYSLAKLFGRDMLEPLLVGHERIRLRWMTPNSEGKLMPKVK